MKSKTQHAPTPWHIDETAYDTSNVVDIGSAKNMHVAFADGGIDIKDAEFIVRAVNSHKALLESLKVLRAVCRQQYRGTNFYCEPWTQKADEAIAQAEGK